MEDTLQEAHRNKKPKKTNLKIYFHNVSGIKSQISPLRASIHTSDYDVIILLETWFNSNIFSSELFDSTWNVFRRDRCDVNNDPRNGGGVLIAVKNDILCETIELQDNSGTENITVRLKIGATFVYMNSVYLPPNLDSTKYESYISVIEELSANLNPTDELLVFGDFNLNDVTWIPDDENECIMNAHDVTADKSEYILSHLLNCGLNQLNDNGNVLDLVFSSFIDDITVEISSHPIKKHSVAHKALEIVFNMKEHSVPNIIQEEYFYDFRRASSAIILNGLNSFDWSSLLNSYDANFCANVLNDILSEVLITQAPKKKRKRKNGAPWLNDTVRNARNLKNRAYKTFVRNGLESDYIQYLNLCDNFNDINKIAYDSYLSRKAGELKKSPRSFWKFVNDNKKKNSIPTLLYSHDTTISTTKDKCDLFADFFQTVYKQYEPVPAEDHASTENLFEVNDLTPTEEEVLSALLKLDTNKGGGPDGISNTFLKMIATAIAKPLSHVFKVSLQSGTFPTIWKKSFIIPIHKSGSRSNVTNYRGIAILNGIPKLLEHLICGKFTSFLRDCFDMNQHGFLKKRNTETNLVSFLHYVINNMENGGQVDAIYTDFSKAFDRVHHGILRNKLRKLGVPQLFVDWSSSYLTGRIQNVRIDSCISKDVIVYSGVPQGSIIGPILFTCFINDCPITDCFYAMYADDLKLFRKINGIEDAHLLQSSLVELVTWCKINQMELNIDKCKCISFTRRNTNNITIYNYDIDGKYLARSNVINDLGVMVDSELRMNDHICHIVNKARRNLGFMKRQARQFNDPFVNKALYCALVRPTLEYCSVVWNPHTLAQINVVESVQKQFLLFALNGLGWRDQYVLPPYQHRLTLLNMETLQDRRKRYDGVFMFKLMTNLLDSPYLQSTITHNSSSYNTRNRCVLTQAQHSTSYGYNETMTRLTRLYNENPDAFMNQHTLNSFKINFKL